MIKTEDVNLIFNRIISYFSIQWTYGFKFEKSFSRKFRAKINAVLRIYSKKESPQENFSSNNKFQTLKDLGSPVW